MINRILHSWSFHMKFMKLAEGSFHKFHIIRSFIYDNIFSCHHLSFFLPILSLTILTITSGGWLRLKENKTKTKKKKKRRKNRKRRLFIFLYFKIVFIILNLFVLLVSGTTEYILE